jgi:hypothetical protein
MAAYLKYEPFVEQVSNKVIDVFGATDVFKAVIHTDDTALSTTSVTSVTQISGTNGYTTGGNTITYTCARSAGTVTFAPTADITWTASGGNLGGSTTGQYFSIYDDTPTTPADPLMCKFDYGADFTVAAGETMTLDFDTTLFTLV